MTDNDSAGSTRQSYRVCYNADEDVIEIVGNWDVELPPLDEIETEHAVRRDGSECDSQNRMQQLAELDHQELAEHADDLETALYHSEMNLIETRGSAEAADRCRVAFEEGDILAFATGDYDENSERHQIIGAGRIKDAGEGSAEENVETRSEAIDRLREALDNGGKYD